MSLLVDDLISTTKSVLSANGIIKLKEMVVGLASFVKNTPKKVMQEQLLRLRETAYLPVCELGVKNLTLMMSTDKFFIADRKELSEAFTKDLPILDFSVDEVRYMRPLIEALDIKKKYLLDSVLETYDMGGIFTTDEVLTSSLRNKCHTIYSCARHYESLKAKGEDSVLPKQLSKLVVTRVEKFQIVRRVASQGFNRVKFFPAQIHFRETAGNISIFLPLVGEEINAIFGFLLPLLLVQWLQITKDKAESVFGNVLLQSGATLSRVLEEEDISTTAIEDYDVGVDDSELGALKPKAESPIAELQAQSTVSNPNEIQISLHMHSKTKVSGAGKSPNQPTNSPDQTLNSTDVDDDFGPQTPFVTRTGPPKRFRVPNSSCVGQGSSLPDSGDDDYDVGPTSRAFHLAFPHLHNRMETLIKAAANQTAGGADIVSSKIAPIGTKAQELTSLVVERSEIKQAQRKRLSKGQLVNGGHNSTKRQKDEAQYVANLGTGFQGEIFAVDMLRGQLNKSDGQFEPEKHWTSSLRSWAKVYDHHKHLTAYTAPEISDITYHDRNGSLSKWLVANGCSRARKWFEASPTYHIEVKSTTGGCDEPFSMSSHQLELAQQMAAIDKLAPEKVYIIIRVYNVYHEPAFRLYVDPWSLIQDGTLSLTPDEYLVRVSL